LVLPKPLQPPLIEPIIIQTTSNTTQSQQCPQQQTTQATSSFSFALQNVTDEIVQGALPSSTVFEVASQVALVDLHFDEVEQSIPVTREDEVVPWFLDETTTLSSPFVHDLTVDLVSYTSIREDTPVQQVVAHDYVQSSSSLALVRSIPVETKLAAEMERLEQVESHTLDTHTTTSVDDGGGILVVPEYTHSNPKINESLELWRRIWDYDKANAETPFILFLSKKHKQHVKQQLQIGKPVYKTRSWGAPRI